jgi:hypothetical protein
MIYDVSYAAWHRVLMGRDTGLAIKSATAKPIDSVTFNSGLG